MANTFVKAEEKRLTAIFDTVNDEMTVAIEDCSKLAATNFLLMLGAKAALAADGYFASAVQVASATVVRLIDEGYLTVTEKGLASEDLKLQRQAERDQHKQRHDEQMAELRSLGAPTRPGQYV